MESAIVQQFLSGQLSFDDLQTLFLVDIDQLYHVKTKLSSQPEPFKNGTYQPIPMIIREAQQASPVADRITDQHLFLRIDNLILRSLNIARNIEHTLAHYQISDAKNTPKKLFSEFLQKALDARSQSEDHDHLHSLESEFNLECLELLRSQGLIGDESSHDHKVLLQHRYLASTLMPAIGQQTFLADPQHQVTIEEICYPITEKTPKQIEKMATENYSRLSYGIRKTNETAFENVQKNDHRLPAQCRYTHKNTVKNGWVVINRIHFPSGNTEEFSYIRSASLPPLGKGLSTQDQIDAASENIAQLKLNAKKFGLPENLHITVLNTQDSAFALINQSQRNQNTIINVTKQAASLQNTRYSYFPVNELGTIKHPEIDSHMQTQEAWKQLNLFHKDVRALNAAKLNVVASEAGHTPVFVCSGGQDRSSVVSEAYSELMTMKAYQKNGIIVSREHIENCRAMGYPTATLSTLAAPGSFGIKFSSKPADLFSESTTNMLFSKIADTNKKAPIAKKATNPQKTDGESFEPAKLAIQQFIARNPKNIFITSLQGIISAIKITDYKATEALKLVYLIASDPIAHAKKIELLTTFAKSMHHQRIKNKASLAIIFALFGFAFLASAFTLFAMPTAGLMAQQIIWNTFNFLVMPYHIQYAAGAIAAVGLQACAISGLLFFNTRQKGAPKEMITLAKTAQSAQHLKAFDTKKLNSLNP